MKQELWHGDCLELMRSIPGKSVDMVLCDLPYGTTQNKWDSVIPFNILWEQYDRVLKDIGAVVLFSGQPFTSRLITSNIEIFKYVWIWEKNVKTGHLNAHHMPMRKHEDICVFYKQKPTYNPQGLLPHNKITRRGSNGSNYGASGTENIQSWTNYPADILRFDRDMPPIHPTQKPLALCEYLIKTYTNGGDLVLDNCMGSGTTCLAAKNLDRQFIGIEKEKEYYDICVERLNYSVPNAPITDHSQSTTKTNE